MLSDLFNAENVEAYLNDELSIEDTLRFEKRLREDRDFKEFVSIYQDVDKAIVEEDVMNLRNSLKSVHEVAGEEWLDDAPMMVENTHDQDIDAAIAEEDVMQLRSMLNDIHDLNKEELYEASGSIKEFSLEELDGLMEDDFEDEDMVAALMEDDVMNLRDQLREIGDEVKREKIKEKKPIYKRASRLIAVASVLLVMIIGSAFYIYFDSKAMKPEKAIAKFYEPVVYRAAQRGADIDAERLKLKLYNAYSNFRNEDYKHALDLLQVIEENPDFQVDMELKATAGMSLFFLDRMDEARTYFEKVLASNDIGYVDLADWFLAGCLLSNREYEKAALKMYHDMATENDHEFKENSRKILKKLKK